MEFANELQEDTPGLCINITPLAQAIVCRSLNISVSCSIGLSCLRPSNGPAKLAISPFGITTLLIFFFFLFR